MTTAEWTKRCKTQALPIALEILEQPRDALGIASAVMATVFEQARASDREWRLALEYLEKWRLWVLQNGIDKSKA